MDLAAYFSKKKEPGRGTVSQQRIKCPCEGLKSGKWLHLQQRINESDQRLGQSECQTLAILNIVQKQVLF